MSCYVKQTGCIKINKLEYDMNIDCLADKIQIDPDSIQNLNNFNLGSQKFISSVKTVE